MCLIIVVPIVTIAVLISTEILYRDLWFGQSLKMIKADKGIGYDKRGPCKPENEHILLYGNKFF